ncbi:MAG: putative O-linked GlcNAc transferase-putative TPR-containing transmembrane protein [Planctomycetota bacterium]|nr:MAG: putative O-linked GlcNAc transferase-putative TPR-containing transmembrane protein [Planctomycetota bacterium]
MSDVTTATVNGGAPFGNRRRHDPLAWIVFVVAVAARAIYFLQYVRSPLSGYLRADHVYYFQWARQIAAGDWLGSGVFQQAPLYPYLLGLTMSIVGERPTMILVLQLLLGAASCALLFGAARRLVARLTAFLAGIVMALYGPCIFYECMLMKSFLSPVLTVVSLYSVLRYQDDRHRRWLWVAGIALGLSCLVAENHILLLIPLGIWLWHQERALWPNWQSRLIAPVQLALATAVALLPSLIRNLVVAGEFIVVTSGGGEVFYMAHGPTAQGYYSTPSFVTGNPFLEHEDFRKEAQRRLNRKLGYGESSRYWAHEGFRSIGNDPLRTVRLTGAKGAILFNDYEVPDGENFYVTTRFIPALRWLPTFGWIVGLGSVGAGLCLYRRGCDWLIVGVAAVHITTVLLLYNFGRFRLGLMPVWIVLAALSTTWLLDIFRPLIRREKLARCVGLGIAVVISFVAFLPPLGKTPPGHLAWQAISTAQLALRQRDSELAAEEFQKVLEIYRDFDQQQPKTARLIAIATLELARIEMADGHVPIAAKHLQAARRLPNRDDLREEILLEWTSLLQEAVRESRSVPEIANAEIALAEAEVELADVQGRLTAPKFKSPSTGSQ